MVRQLTDKYLTQASEGLGMVNQAVHELNRLHQGSMRAHLKIVRWTAPDGAEGQEVEIQYTGPATPFEVPSDPGDAAQRE